MSIAKRKITNQKNKQIKSAYGPKTREQIGFPDNSRWTKQSFKDECDINNVMNRYLSTGEVPVLNERAPQYLDVTGIEFQEKMEFIAGAKTLFQELPSSIRNRFQNDPAQFLDFCSQKKNRPEMAEMGLLSDEAAAVYINPPPLSPEPPTAPKSAPESKPEPS